MATRDERDLTLRHAGFPRRVRAAILDDGGGSAFAHLSEDTDISSVAVDWDLVVAADAETAQNVGSGDWVVIKPSGLIQQQVTDAATHVHEIGVDGDGAPRLLALGDGSLHWGDGTAAPDASLSLDNIGGDGKGLLKFAGAHLRSEINGIGYAVRLPGDPYDKIQLYGDDGSIWAGDGTTADTDTDWTRFAAGVWQISANGGGIRLTSPDGTQHKTVRLSNAGALELV